MLNFHTHNQTKNAIINIDTIDEIYIDNREIYSIGNHPWYNKYSIVELEQYIQKYPQIIAIGECGIDKIKSNIGLDEQLEMMKEQIILSEKYKLPIILHVVKGFNEIIKLKKDLNPTQQWVIHGFNNYKQTKELIENGFYISYGVVLLKNELLQNALKFTPIDKIFFETDDNDIEIEKLYTFASEILGVTIDKLIAQIRKNLRTITNGKLATTTGTIDRYRNSNKTQN